MKPKEFIKTLLSYKVVTNDGYTYKIIGADYNGVDALIDESRAKHEFIDWGDIKKVIESNGWGSHVSYDDCKD